MEVVNDPDSGAAELKDVIETDAALSARILRCVNSSAYATRTEVTSLQQAIAYLGLNQIRNLAVTASVSELFKRDDKIGPYCRSQLWRHLVSVGNLCAADRHATQDEQLRRRFSGWSAARYRHCSGGPVRS